MSEHSNKIRVLAYYLPQFHPIPENDKWWGKGFTEWTNVGKARKLFPGHYQPHVPADLGYYDLRINEARQAQADLAREYGVEGFIYWHYWFGGGKRILERPFNEVLSSGKPDFPFALAWANEDWRGIYHGLTNDRVVLVKQTYPGDQDYIDHFYSVLPAFKDPRYITINGKPLFVIYKSEQIPDAAHFISLWQKLARENGLAGLTFVAYKACRQEDEVNVLKRLLSYGFDYVNFIRFDCHTWPIWQNLCFRTSYKLLRRLSWHILPEIHIYRHAIKYFYNDNDKLPSVIPTLVPNWDNTPRCKNLGMVMLGSSPNLFQESVEMATKNICNKKAEERLLFVKSWNEWAEGNYLEPDLKWGTQYLEALKAGIER